MLDSAPRLYGITDTQLLPGPALLQKVEAALAGGCAWLQYRDKSTDVNRRRREAQNLLDLCDSYNAKLIINDDVGLAASIGAHGVHLGQDDESVAAARSVMGADAIIGATCHNSLALASAAQSAGASYVAFGRFYGSATKPAAGTAPLHILTQARRELSLPIVAIGGISLATAAEILAAGADTLAICAGLFDCDDPAGRARALCEIAPALAVD